MIRSVNYIPVFVILLWIGFICPSVRAMSGTDQVARPGEPVDVKIADVMGWPEGVLGLINDPARTDGWNPWFSEWPNDVHHYEFHFRNTGDLNRFIRKLDRVESDTRLIVLSPESEPRALGFSTVLKEGNGASGLFSIGSQKRLDQWFKQLPDGQFGMHHLTEAPKAMPPTLTLYVDHPAIDLTKLQIPTDINVEAKQPEPVEGQEAQKGPLHEAIRTFVEDHKTKQEAEARKVAIELLLKTDVFADDAVGIAGVVSEQVKAFRLIMDQSDAAEVFSHILRKGTVAGQLYALCGLYSTDHDLFRQTIDRYKSSRREVRAEFGCIMYTLAVSELVYNDDPDTVRLKPGQTLSEWRSEHHSDHLRLDISGGGYPSLFAGKQP